MGQKFTKTVVPNGYTALLKGCAPLRNHIQASGLDSELFRAVCAAEISLLRGLMAMDFEQVPERRQDTEGETHETLES